MNSIEWMNGRVRFLDQTRLPNEERFVETESIDVVAEAIRGLQLRGAPLIGIAAAYAIVLGVKRAQAAGRDEFLRVLDESAALITSTRPTAKNLFWAAERLSAVARLNTQMQGNSLYELLEREASAIHREDEEMCAAIGRYGAELIPEDAVILTHCNTGSLATGGIGTALGAVITAHRQGKRISVIADETRPLLQGARLTAWELVQEGIPVTLIPDTAMAATMLNKKCKLAIVGADRITANGDAANKIGTLAVAICARYHNIPFYVAAPTSTFDCSLESGAGIPIEERSPDEVTSCGGMKIAPEGIGVYNPAFDVTPHELITGIITEAGVLRPPYAESIRTLFSRRGQP